MHLSRIRFSGGSATTTTSPSRQRVGHVNKHIDSRGAPPHKQHLLHANIYKPFTFGLSGDGKAHILCITISFHKWDFIFLLQFFLLSFFSFVRFSSFFFALNILCAVCVVGPFSGFYTRVGVPRELRFVCVCVNSCRVYSNVWGYVKIALLPLAIKKKKNAKFASLHT